VHVDAIGDLTVDRRQEFLELDRAVALMQLADLASGDVQGRR